MKWIMNWGWILLYSVVLMASVLFIAADNREPIEETQAEKITLTFRHFWITEHDRQMLEIFEDVVHKYQESHPNVKVNFEGMDQTEHREQKLKGEMVTGTPPDMFVLFGGAEIEPYVRSNRLMDLSDFVKENGLQDQFQDLHLWTFNNKIYGLPIEGNAEPLYYNMEIFEKLGIGPPETLSQLNHAIDILKKNGYIPFALGNEERWPAGIFAHYLMDRFAGPELINDLVQGQESQRFDNQDYLQAFDQLENWIKQEAFSPSSNTLSTEEAIKLFTNEKAAMYLNGNWDINLFHNEDAPANFQDKVGVIPFPSLLADDNKSIAGGYTIGIGLSSNMEDAKKEAAEDLLKALFTKEVQSSVVYKGLRIPSMKVSYDYNKTGPIFAQVIALMEVNHQSFVPYDNILSPEVKKSFLKVIEEMIAGDTSAKEALEEIQVSSQEYWKQRRDFSP